MFNRHEIRVARVIRQVRHMEQKLRIILEHLSTPPVFSGVCVAKSLVLCVVPCRSLYVLLCFFWGSLYCLSLWILITPLVS